MEIHSDVLVFRSLAATCATVAEGMIREMGLIGGLVVEKRRQEILRDLYEGIARLGVRLDSWEKALTQTRALAALSADDRCTRQAYELLLWQTNYLYV